MVSFNGTEKMSPATLYHSPSNDGITSDQASRLSAPITKLAFVDGKYIWGADKIFRMPVVVLVGSSLPRPAPIVSVLLIYKNNEQLFYSRSQTEELVGNRT